MRRVDQDVEAALVRYSLFPIGARFQRRPRSPLIMSMRGSELRMPRAEAFGLALKIRTRYPDKQVSSLPIYCTLVSEVRVSVIILAGARLRHGTRLPMGRFSISG